MSNRYFNKAIRKDIYSNRYNGNTYSFVVATHLDTLSQDPTSTGIVFTGPTSIPEYQQFVPLTYNNCIVFGINGNLTPLIHDRVKIKDDLEVYGAVRIKGCYNPLCLDGDAYFHKSLNVDSTISQG